MKDIDNIKDETEKKKLLLELLVSILALEGVKFYVSFLATYIINNNYKNAISGATRIIKLINFDEDLHTSMISGTLQILKKEKIEGFSEIIKSDWFENMAKDKFRKVYEDEMEWARYLLSFGNIPSLTEKAISNFMKYYVDNRLGSIGIGKIYNEKKSDIVMWFENYKDLNKDNSALQESDLAVYSIGIMKNDIPDGKIELRKSGDR